MKNASYIIYDNENRFEVSGHVLAWEIFAARTALSYNVQGVFLVDGCTGEVIADNLDSMAS